MMLLLQDVNCGGPFLQNRYTAQLQYRAAAAGADVRAGAAEADHRSLSVNCGSFYCALTALQGAPAQLYR